MNFREFSCCCYGCLHGTEACDNQTCPCDWSGFDLGKRKATEANLQYWLGEIMQNIRNICNATESAPRQGQRQVN